MSEVLDDPARAGRAPAGEPPAPGRPSAPGRRAGDALAPGGTERPGFAATAAVGAVAMALGLVVPLLGLSLLAFLLGDAVRLRLGRRRDVVAPVTPSRPRPASPR